MNGRLNRRTTFQSPSVLTSAFDFKDSVFVATTANITLSGAQTIDGQSVTAGKRVLVKNQSTGSQNGIYVAAAGAWSRSSDADANAEVTAGMTVPVEQGTVNGGKAYTLTTAGTITVGSTSLTFSATGGAVASVDGQTGAVDLTGTYAPVAVGALAKLALVNQGVF